MSFRSVAHGDKLSLIHSLNRICGEAYESGAYVLGDDLLTIVDFLKELKGRDLPELDYTLRTLEHSIQYPDIVRQFVAREWQRAARIHVPDVSAVRKQRYIFAGKEERAQIERVWQEALPIRGGDESSHMLHAEALNRVLRLPAYAPVPVEEAIHSLVEDGLARPEEAAMLARSMHSVAEHLYHSNLRGLPN